MEVSISSLGGVGEIGMNMYVYETAEYVIIIDCGVKFAKVDDPGIDFIIPDFTYIEDIKEKKILLLISHAHEDHIGGIPYLLSRFPNIIVGGNLYSLEVLRYKLKEFDINCNYIQIEARTPFEWGDFEVTPYPMSHSIYETNIFVIRLNDGFTFLHMSDYKIDFACPTGNIFPLKDLVDISSSGVNCLLGDSTNITVNGFTSSEHSIINNLDEIFAKAKGRIFFTTFSSNLERLQTVFNLAKKYDRYIAIEGSSLMKNIEIARKLSKFHLDEELIISRKQIERLEDKKICVIATGSQGETNSVINKISQNDFSNIKVRETDLFIFSSRVIPGNEQWFLKVINNIYMNNGSCITGENKFVHVSGHSAKEDIIMLLKLVNPDYLIPIHGEMQHLIEHKKVALSLGMAEDNIIPFVSGTKLTFNNNILVNKSEIVAEKSFVDVKRDSILSYSDLKKRRQLATEGAVVVFVSKSNINNITKASIIITYLGFDLSNEYNDLLYNALLDTAEPYSLDNIDSNMERIIKHFFKKRFNKRPIIQIVIH